MKIHKTSKKQNSDKVQEGQNVYLACVRIQVTFSKVTFI